MIIKTNYFEIRPAHLTKKIKGLAVEELSKFYSVKKTYNTAMAAMLSSAETPWRLRLLSVRIWEEVIDTDTGEVTVKISKCPKELRNNTAANDKAFTLAKIAAVDTDPELWS